MSDWRSYVFSSDLNDNGEVALHGTPPTFDFAPREHDDIAPALGMDFETGVKLAGARFTLLRGPVARLYRALGQFMLPSLSRDHGYEQDRQSTPLNPSH